MSEKELVFEVHWIEKLKKCGEIIWIIAIFIYGLMILMNGIFWGSFLIILISITIFIILSIFVFNKKLVISQDVLIYYDRGKEILCRKVKKDNIRIFYEKKWYSSELKYLLVDYYDIPVYLFGNKNCLKLEKIISKIQFETKEIKNTVFEIPKKELLVEKFKDIFKNNAIGVIFALIIVIIYSDAIFLKYFLIIIPLGVIVLEIISLVKMKIYTPKIIRIFSNFISVDDEKYSKYDIKKLMLTSLNTKNGTMYFGYRILKIFKNDEKKIYILIASKNSEFKNSGKYEDYKDYEIFYREIIKFCVANDIEYELV